MKEKLILFIYLISKSIKNMIPAFDWLVDQKLDTANTVAKINAMQTLGVPYPIAYAAIANKDLDKQAKAISANLAIDKIKVGSDREIIAIITYLQRLGTDIKNNPSR